MNTTLIYKEHGINIIRRDFHVRNDNEQNVVNFVKELIAKGIIDANQFNLKLDEALNETRIELNQAIKETNKELKMVIIQTLKEKL